MNKDAGREEVTAQGGRGAVPVHDGPAPDATAGNAERPAATPAISQEAAWPLFEVFVRARRGLSHNHVGSLHASDEAMALRNARDVYTRRQEGTSIWVVRSSALTASSPDEKESFFDPAADKIYRHPTFYDVPGGVQM